MLKKKKKNSARVALSNRNKYDHIAPPMSKLISLNVQYKCNYDTCILVYKIIQLYNPAWPFTSSNHN